MKHLSLFLVLLVTSTQGFSQAKLLARSNYNYNDTTSTAYLSDSTKYFYKPGNPTYSNQVAEDALVAQKEDSTWYYGSNGGPLTKNARSFFTYNAAYTATTTYDDTIYSAGVPFLANRSEYYYNGTNYDSIITRQTTYPAATTYISYKQYFHQNAQNLIDTLWMVYFNATGAYVSSYKQVTLYNAPNLTSATYSYNSNDSVTYIPDSRIDYSYGPANRLDSMMVYTYQTPNWIKAERREYVYNASNNKIKVEYKGINQPTLAYIPISRDEYIRNNGTQMDSLFSQLWNSGSMKYDTTVKRGYQHSNGLLTRMYAWNYDVPTSSWVPNPYGWISNFYYDMVSSVSSVNKNRGVLNIYPNPVGNALRWTDQDAEGTYCVLSTDGRLVQRGNVGDQAVVSTDHLPAGTYILLVETAQATKSSVFVKQ